MLDLDPDRDEATQALLEEAGLGRRLGRRRRARVASVWIGSTLLHLILVAGLSAYVQAVHVPTPAAAFSPRRTSGPSLFDLRRARIALVEWARDARAKGQLVLGDFLLAANALDAKEERVGLDEGTAMLAYRARVSKLRRALASNPPEVVVPEVFEDLAYTGTPGGRMAETLISRRGSCEPVSHLVAAALYDAGLQDAVHLRFYGAAAGGVTHITPVVVDRVDGSVIDLMTGGPAQPGGTEFPASELVDAYARVHGLGGRESAGGGPIAAAAGSAAGGVTQVARTRTLTSGYPPNADRFGGGLPLFAERAIARRGSADGPVEAREPPPCSFFLSMAWLDPPSADVLDREAIDVDLVRAPTPFELEHLSSNIIAIEAQRTPSDRLASRLLGQACLAGLYDRAGLLFSLAGQTPVAQRCARAARQERTSSESAIAQLDGLEPTARAEVLREIDRATFGRSWVLLFLDEADAAVDSIAHDDHLQFGRITALAAMIVSPRTRQSALGVVNDLPLELQIDVMHELTHAHDNARPWSGSYALDIETLPEELRNLSFVRGYHVFAGLAWRLWEAAKPAEQTIVSFVREAERAGLDSDAKEAMALYYMKQYFRLHKPRQNGDEQIAMARTVLSKHGFSAVERLSDEQLRR